MIKENINYKMVDIFLSSPDFFAQDAATKLIVTVQEIKKLLKKNPSRKFEDLSKDLKSQLTKLVIHLVYFQKIAFSFALGAKPFIRDTTIETIRNLTVDEIFEIYDGFCENLDIDSYNLQIKKVISSFPPPNNK